ncbi:L-lysine 6-monooxygenase (NADPH-requiring)-domain-containing protein [Suillus clintonianus]|uniref:L-lysine 6-monooxygenase (NADPH-requiring)-domain-containing protein n=1 Tax=Suillus clintonianus TaxID=1904413 RepID=UPI001B868B81|nr:L-lysine 6-monooxygenase (NADPH-requiring)-domain-containing protein [Suillus clintonianus]KAG2150896.1 L-lysine 6-monooxygenase (NADPH-requiring)-domain-containing protein [Suillus clintonianus]
MASSELEAHPAGVYDVIGLGFGPANLAVAGALLEQPRETCPISVNRCLFIERHHEFKWHPGMLLPGTRMQISFLKDLATLRSPQSPITFLAYLHSQNRLVDFINRGCTTPTRKEYSDYLTYVAQYVQGQGIRIAYGENVIAFEEGREGTIQVHSRVLTTGVTIIRLTKNLIISPGGSPWVPRCIQAILPHPRIIHSSEYLCSVEPVLATLKATTRSLKIAVVGAGQSAVEVLLDLRSRLTSMGMSDGQAHNLHLIIRGGSLKPSDGGPFANQVYNPEYVDVMYNLPSDSRKRVMADYKTTNYGAVNPRTLDSLYEVMYDHQVDGDIARRRGNTTPVTSARITIIPYSNLSSAEINTHPSQTCSEPDTLSILLQNTLTQDFSEAIYDVIICATGYERYSWMNLLKSSSLGKQFGLCATSNNTCLAVERDLGATANRKNGNVLTAVNGKNGNFAAAANGRNGHSRTPDMGVNAQDLPCTSLETKISDTLYISRRYRLLPLPTTGHGFIPRIYLQGCAEDTHGLSETLLSVAAIRAGEMVEDLCSNY